MDEKRGRGRPHGSKPPASAPALADVPVPPVPHLRQLRQRWELASVLNFLHVFKKLIASDLEISAEEIETGLISPNRNLALIHVTILKGIRPVTKKMMDGDAWVTIVCKKLATWWHWVAEGENPLEADHGKEIARYKGLDPTTRLLILKALCEVRAIQDDILRHIAYELKNGIPITAFRKERIGGDDNGITYWYDGDPVIGHRLYRETIIVESKRKKVKGCPIEPQWETLATNLEEFQEISDNLLSSKNSTEADVGEIIKTDVIPVLEKLQKKKEQALKRKQRQTLLLDGYLNSSENGTKRSRRERKPVKYTFDDYDQRIEEAIEISKNSKKIGPFKDSDEKTGVGNQDTVLNGSLESDKENFILDNHGSLPEFEDGEHTHRTGNDSDDADEDDDDYDEKDDKFDGSNADDVYEDISLGDSDEEVDLRRSHATRSQKDVNAKVVLGLRRSRRTTGSTNGSNFDSWHAEAKGPGEMKKRLRQRPTRNTGNSDVILSNSEDESSSEANKQTEASSDTECEASTSATSSDELQDSDGAHDNSAGDDDCDGDSDGVDDD